jgi:histidine triad (HIT) family protein
MPSVFTQIINHQIPAHIVAENEQFIAFLDIRPLAKGHTLVVPKMEIDYIFDLEDDLLGEIMIFAKRVAKGIRKAVPCLRVGVAVVGLEVAHAHLHLVPLNHVNDIDFKKEPLSYTSTELADIAAIIQVFIEK